MLTRQGHARRKLLLSSAQSALLYLPLMRMFRDSEALAQTASEPKAIFTYFPTGFKDGNFWPDGGSGPIGNFPGVLKPIEELGLKNDFLLMDGLDFHGSYDHNGGLTQTFAGWGGAGLWEGAGIRYLDNAINGQTLDQMMPRPYSLDQMLADKWGCASINVGVATRRTSFPDPLSWKKDGVKNKSEDNPKVTFDRYFGKFMPGAGGSTGAAEAAKKVAMAEKRIVDFFKDRYQAH